MNNFFFGVAGVVLALWFVAVCNEMPLFIITLPTVATVPYNPIEKSTCYNRSVNNSHCSTATPVNRSYCSQTYVVEFGETQWQIASYYAGSENKALWLRQMRYLSHLAWNDNSLHPGQVLCVQWQ